MSDPAKVIPLPCDLHDVQTIKPNWAQLYSQVAPFVLEAHAYLENGDSDTALSILGHARDAVYAHARPPYIFNYPDEGIESPF